MAIRGLLCLRKRVRAMLLFFFAAAALCLAAGGQGEMTQVEVRLPPDILFADSPDSPAAVVFSHQTHAAFVDNRCLTCHPQPFSILGRHEAVRHEAMNEGRSCGTCHNGNDATGVEDADNCESCHTGRPESTGGAPGPADGTPAGGPGPVTFAAGSDSPGTVTFRHATHLDVPGACAACHPRPFAMRAGKTALDKEAMFEGATCGACHDGKTAFGVDDVDRCETCHDVEGGPS